MDFELSQEQKMLRDMARKFAEQDMLPSLREYESARKVNYALLKKMASLDLRGIHIPKEYGGSGLSYSDAVIIWEQLSQASWTQTLISLGDSVLAGTILECGQCRTKRAVSARDVQCRKLYCSGRC